MKKLILITAFVLGLFTISLNSYAQQKSRPFSHYSEETLNAINATPEQKQAIRELAAKYRVEFKNLRDQQSSLSKEEYNAQRKKLNAARSREYGEITTPEQKEKLKELRAEHRKKNQ